MSLEDHKHNGGKRSNETTSLLTTDGVEGNENPSQNIFRYGEFTNDDGEKSYDSDGSQDIRRILSKDQTNEEENGLLSAWTIACILSSSFAYGCIMTTLFLITLPIECERIEQQIPTIPKSVSSIKQSKLVKHFRCAPMSTVTNLHFESFPLTV